MPVKKAKTKRPPWSPTKYRPGIPALGPLPPKELQHSPAPRDPSNNLDKVTYQPSEDPNTEENDSIHEDEGVYQTTKASNSNESNDDEDSDEQQAPDASNTNENQDNGEHVSEASSSKKIDLKEPVSEKLERHLTSKTEMKPEPSLQFFPPPKSRNERKADTSCCCAP